MQLAFKDCSCSQRRSLFPVGEIVYQYRKQEYESSDESLLINTYAQKNKRIIYKLEQYDSENSTHYGSFTAAEARSAYNAGCQDIHFHTLSYTRHRNSESRSVQYAGEAAQKSRYDIHYDLNFAGIDTGQLCGFFVAARVEYLACRRTLVAYDLGYYGNDKTNDEYRRYPQ